MTRNWIQWSLESFWSRTLPNRTSDSVLVQVEESHCLRELIGGSQALPGPTALDAFIPHCESRHGRELAVGWDAYARLSMHDR
jgi:hypothetical protein